MTVRRPTLREHEAAALGFRCAADEGVGLTRAAELVNNLPPKSYFEQDYAPKATVGRDRWATLEGSVNAPDYRVIINYERALFVPLEKIPYSALSGTSRGSLGNASVQNAPVPLGLLDMSIEGIGPELYPDTYVLAYRGPGDKRKVRGSDSENDEVDTQSSRAGQDEEVEDQDPVLELIDSSVHSIVVYDLKGSPLQAFEIPAPTQIKDRKDEEDSELAIRRWVEPKRVEEGEVLIPADTLVFTIRIPSDKRGTDFEFEVPFKVAADSITDDWR